MNLPISTKTLVLRPFRAGDLDALVAYRNDLDIARFQYWEGISLDEAVAFVRRNADSSPGGRESGSKSPSRWARTIPGLAILGSCCVMTARRPNWGSLSQRDTRVAAWHER